MPRRAILLIVALFCVACAAPQRYQLPQQERDLHATVHDAQSAYQYLYLEHKANRLTKAGMDEVDTLYEAWRRTQAYLVEAIEAGAVRFQEVTP